MNVLTVPNSGILSFDNVAFPSSTVQPLSTAPRLGYDGIGGLKLTSYVTTVTSSERFSVDGSSGRLFTVADALTGTIFSVNDISGLPIVEVYDTDAVIMGEYTANTLVVSGRKIGIRQLPTGTETLQVSGNLVLNSNTFRLSLSSSPASATDAGTTGDIRWDTTSLYICVSTNYWKKASLVNL